MKYMKRANIYKASNVIFEPDTCQAYSYAWWRFVDRINGKVVFNNYSYSMSTCKHQSKVRSLLHELGINIDLFIECPKGLQARDGLQSAVDWYRVQIDNLQRAIDNPRSRKATNARRIQEIAAFQVKLDQINALKAGE